MIPQPTTQPIQSPSLPPCSTYTSCPKSHQCAEGSALQMCGRPIFVSMLCSIYENGMPIYDAQGYVIGCENGAFVEDIVGTGVEVKVYPNAVPCT